MHSSTTRAIGNIVTGLVPVFVGGRQIDAIPFTHEGVEMARTPDDNRAAMNVHEAAASARVGDRGGTFSTVARIMRAWPDGAVTAAQAAHTILGPCGRSPWETRGTGGRTAWYRHPASAAIVAAALVGGGGEERSDEPLDERAARGAMAKACPSSGGDEQAQGVEWDGHGSGGGAVGGDWETRLNPGDAVAFAIEQGGRVKVIGPGEVADITFASLASVVTRARTAARASGGEGGDDSNDEGGAESGVDDPGRTHAGSGSPDPPPAETSTGDLGRWVNDGFRRIEGPADGQAGDGGVEVAADCPSPATVDSWRRRYGGHRRPGAVDSCPREQPPREGAGSADLLAMAIAWAMEQCGIHTLVNSNRQVALAHIEALGFLAAAGRALPFVGWATRRASAAPGVNIPGMRHRNPLIFDTAGGHRGGDAERLLEPVVRRIESSGDSHRACEGPGGDRDDRGREDVNMTSEGAAAREGRGGCDGYPRLPATVRTGRTSNAPVRSGRTSVPIARNRAMPTGTPAMQETLPPVGRPTAARLRATLGVAS